MTDPLIYRGPVGPVPGIVWSGTYGSMISFEQPNGSYSTPVDLRGPPGASTTEAQAAATQANNSATSASGSATAAASSASQAQASTTQSNYGTVASPYYAQVARPISAHFGDMITLLDEGGDPTATDNSGALQRALTKAAGSANGRPIFLQPGVYQIGSPVTCNAPVSIYGAGMGAGPGEADSDNAHSTVLVPTFASGDVITLTTDQTCSLRDFRVQQGSGLGFGSGSMIKIAGGATNTLSHIQRVRFDGKDVGLYIRRGFKPMIQGCYFGDWGTAGIKMDTDNTHEGCGGVIFGNIFFSSQVSGAGLLLGHGYTDVINNHFLGGAFGIHVAIAAYPAGSVRIFDNILEENDQGTIYIETLDGSQGSMFTIERNEFSNVADTGNLNGHIIVAEYASSPATQWLEGVTVRHNIFRSALTKAGSKYVWVQAGLKVTVDENDFISVGSGQPVGVQITGSSTSANHGALGTHLRARNNTFMSGLSGTDLTTRFSLNTVKPTLVIDDNSVSFAALNTTYANAGVGSRIYVYDGTPNSFPLTGGGTGTWAERGGDGVWRGY